MADADKDSKTEDPTDKKLSEARGSGQFAKAPEIGMVFSLIATLLVFVFYGPSQAFHLGNISVGVLAHLHEFDVTPEGVEYTFGTSMKGVMYIVMPLMVITLFTGILAEGLQTGFRFTPKVLGFKPNRLNPISGIKRLFSPTSLVTFFVDFLKFLAIGSIVALLVRDVMKDPIFYTPVPITHVGIFIYNLFKLMLIRLIIVLGIIAAIHYLYQVRKTAKDMKMTKEEVKEERKSKEVSPEIKNAQRAMAMQMMNKQMLDSVPTADVVVTNPTHFAVALKYERGRDKAPLVLAKGKNLFAQRIKGIANTHSVPMVENVQVARMLYKYGMVGKSIPIELYQVVAEILAYVYKTHSYYFHRLKARRIKAQTHG